MGGQGFSNDYRNALVAEERRRRDETEKLLLSLFPAVALLDQQKKQLDIDIETIRQDMRDTNAKAKKRVPQPDKAYQVRMLVAQVEAMKAQLIGNLILRGRMGGQGFSSRSLCSNDHRG